MPVPLVPQQTHTEKPVNVDFLPPAGESEALIYKGIFDRGPPRGGSFLGRRAGEPLLYPQRARPEVFGPPPCQTSYNAISGPFVPRNSFPP